MDLQFTEKEDAFRQEIKAFFRANVPDSIRQRMIEGKPVEKSDLKAWIRVLDSKGWAAPHWPLAFGGTGWSPIEQYIFMEERQRFPAPQPVPFGVNMVGPVIYTFGNQSQKERFLPRIRRLDDWWCQGFSEPDAGSDLASLKTSAIRRGDSFIVNGQKTWITYAQHADWIFCLVRTDPQAKKQAGLSFLLIDMKTTGIEVRPIITIDGAHEINEVFFTDVKVPLENLLGEENHGWDYAKYLLGSERTNITGVGASKQRLTRIRALASRELAGGRPMIEDRTFHRKLVSLEIELKALEITQLRVVAAEANSGNVGKPNPASSYLKIKGTEIQQASTHLLMELMGPHASRDWSSINDGSEQILPDYGSHVTSQYFNYRKVSIYGGSNEIQKNIIARAILGL